MKVKVMFGTIRQGEEVFRTGEIIDIHETKLPRFGFQVSPVIEEPSPPSLPPKEPDETKEPEPPLVPPKEEDPDSEETEDEPSKKRGKN